MAGRAKRFKHPVLYFVATRLATRCRSNILIVPNTVLCNADATVEYNVFNKAFTLLTLPHFLHFASIKIEPIVSYVVREESSLLRVSLLVCPTRQDKSPKANSLPHPQTAIPPSISTPTSDFFIAPPIKTQTTINRIIATANMPSTYKNPISPPEV